MVFPAFQYRIRVLVLFYFIMAIFPGRAETCRTCQALNFVPRARALQYIRRIIDLHIPSIVLTGCFCFHPLQIISAICELENRLELIPVPDWHNAIIHCGQHIARFQCSCNEQYLANQKYGTRSLVTAPIGPGYHNSTFRPTLDSPPIQSDFSIEDGIFVSSGRLGSTRDIDMLPGIDDIPSLEYSEDDEMDIDIDIVVSPPSYNFMHQATRYVLRNLWTEGLPEDTNDFLSQAFNYHDFREQTISITNHINAYSPPVF